MKGKLGIKKHLFRKPNREKNHLQQVVILEVLLEVTNMQSFGFNVSQWKSCLVCFPDQGKLLCQILTI